MNEEDRKIIEEYDDHREERRQKEEEAVKATLEALKPIIESNRAYLKYAQAQGWFELSPQEEEAAATHNGLVTVIGRALNFDVLQARKLTFEILEDVNDHQNAREVASILGLKLKSYEIE